jgi:EAL domain-containing protein (putative c-di-GMP-specific phosphodiesterase class I)
VDLVKIDGSFVHNVHENAHNRAFVRMFTDLAKELDLEVVAEWVENEEVSDLLKQMGVDYLQGYHFGKASLAKPWISPDGVLETELDQEEQKQDEAGVA